MLADMANLKEMLIVVTLAATCLAVKPPGYVEKPPVHDESPPRYSFEYEVRDPEGGAQGHTEVRRGVYAVGGFYTRLPGENGAQRVSYYADDWGFHPVLVAYGGHGYKTRLAFGDKAVATANAAAGYTGGSPGGGATVNAIGVNIPQSVNPLPDLTQTGAAALAAEAPQIPDAATLVASVGQPPAPPQPPKPGQFVAQTGPRVLQTSPQILRPVQPYVQQIRPVQSFGPLLQPQRQRIPFPLTTLAPSRPAISVSALTPSSTYPQVQSYAPIGLGYVGLSRPVLTSHQTSENFPARRPSVITQTESPVIVSTTPAPVTLVSHSIGEGNDSGPIYQGVTGTATSYVSSGPQTISKEQQYQSVTPSTTIISSGRGDLAGFKESSAAAAAAAASALAAAASSASQSGVQETSLGGHGEGIYYSRGNGGGGSNALSSGSYVGSAGTIEQQSNSGGLLGVLGQTVYSQDGGYRYERPTGVGLTYAPVLGTTYGRGEVVDQGVSYTPFTTTEYRESGYTYSPEYQEIYQSGPQFVYGSGATSTSSTTKSTSSGLQGSSSGSKSDGSGFSLIANQFASTSRPQGATSFQSQVDHNQIRPGAGNYQGIGVQVGNVGFNEQQTIVSTPASQVSVEDSFNVTPRPSRPIIVAEFPKESTTPTPVIETSTPSPTYSPEITSSTIASSVSPSIEVTTPTPLTSSTPDTPFYSSFPTNVPCTSCGSARSQEVTLFSTSPEQPTSSTPITPYYSTFPSNSPCIACQSTRSQDFTLLTAPATDASSTTLDAELQQVFFPDPTPSLEIVEKEEKIIDSTPRPVDVTPKPFDLGQRIADISNKQTTVSVQVLDDESSRGTTTTGLSISNQSGEKSVFSAQRGSVLDGSQYFSEASGGSGQIFGGNSQLYSGSGGSTIYSGGSSGGAQIYTGTGGGSSQIYSAERINAGQSYFGSSSGGKGFPEISSGGGYFSGSGSSESLVGGQIFTVTSTPAPSLGVSELSLGVTPAPTPSVLYVDRPVAVPVPYAVPQLDAYSVKGSSGSYKERNNHRQSSSSSSSSSESYESSTPSVISVTQITKIRTSGSRKNGDRGYVKQIVEESGSSSSEEEDEEEVIVRGGSVKLASEKFGSDESYYRHRLPPPPFRSSTVSGGKNSEVYGERVRIGRPRKLCIEYGGFKPPLVPSYPDYTQSIHLR